MPICYRPFRNGDPPSLAEIWRSQPPERGLMQPMSADLFEHMVLSKPYFENEGLTVAVDGQRPIGFVHGAFGPSDDGNRLSCQLGVTCLVMVRIDYQRRGIGAELLARSEAYLRRRGAQVLYAGAVQPLNGFYLGLYGGSELPGVLDSAPRAQYLFKSQGYREIDRIRVLHRELAGFRAPVDRGQIQIRRKTNFHATIEPVARTWWEACTWGVMERTRFELSSRECEAPLASASFWSIEPLAHSWGVRAAGLIELDVQPAHRRQGLATYLLSESFKQLQSQGTSLIEVQTMVHNSAAAQLYQKLGFRQIDQGAVFRKESP